MKKLLLIFLFLLFTIKSEATLIKRYFEYEATSTVTDVNLDGNYNNIINVVNGDLDNTNIRTSTHRLYELLGSVPAAGTQGRIVFNTVENTLNFDTGSSWYVSPTYIGTAASGEILYYDGTNWNRTSGTTPAIKITVTSGNVGIGNSAPLGRFQVGTTPGVPLLIVKDSGNVGIGTSNPLAPLDVQGVLIADTGTFTTLTTTTVDGNITANTGTFTTLKFGTQTNTLPAGTGTQGQLLVTNGSGGWVYGGGIPGTISKFTGSDTWTRPSTVDKVFVRCWGPGGDGQDGTYGGGGGGYAEGIITVTGNVTVTVGTTSGGTSSFGTDIICGGGTNLGIGGTCTGGSLQIAGGAASAGDGVCGGSSPMGGGGGCSGTTNSNASLGGIPGGGGGSGAGSGNPTAGADGLVVVYY